jgi:hypothetical protein
MSKEENNQEVEVAAVKLIHEKYIDARSNIPGFNDKVLQQIQQSTIQHSIGMLVNRIKSNGYDAELDDIEFGFFPRPIDKQQEPMPQGMPDGHYYKFIGRAKVILKGVKNPVNIKNLNKIHDEIEIEQIK